MSVILKEGNKGEQEAQKKKKKKKQRENTIGKEKEI